MKLYSTSQYKTLVEDYTDSESIKYNYSVKAFNKENEYNFTISSGVKLLFTFLEEQPDNIRTKEINDKTTIFLTVLI